MIAANVLLGVSQGLTWSMTVNMKIDLIGPARRGVALGINETAGYLGVAVTALATGYLATGLWRDAGYAIGALIGGVTAVLASLDAAVGVAAVLTAVSGILAWAFMRETHPRPAADSGSARAAAGEAARRVNGGMT